MKKARILAGFLTLCLLPALCGCAAVPDFSEHVKYGITDYPGAAEGTTVYDYLRSVATPEAATGSETDVVYNEPIYHFDHARVLELLKDAQIPDLDEADERLSMSLLELPQESEHSSYSILYINLKNQTVIAQYFANGRFIKTVNLTSVGARHPKLVTFDSRDESVALLKP